MKKSISAITVGGLDAMSRPGTHLRQSGKLPTNQKSGRKGAAPSAPRLTRRQSWTVFIGEWLRSPRKIGAICPSSSVLASVMAGEVPAGNGLVVELGAGTGAVTAALLSKGIAAKRLVAVEQSAALAACLRRRFPDITVVEGDAAALSKILPDKPVDCIVSSIPLVSLPESARRAIIREIKETLRGNRLIQYTYLWGGAFLEKSGLQPLGSRLVLRNIPPARVMTFAAGTPNNKSGSR